MPPDGTLATQDRRDGVSEAAILEALPHPVLLVATDGAVLHANLAAEQLFGSSLTVMRRGGIEALLPFGSPILPLIEQARGGHSPVWEHRIDISSPRIGRGRVVDAVAAPARDPEGAVVVTLMPRSTAEMIDRHLTHRGALRSITGLAAVLAHEIRNPLAGIRGAAQLVGMSASGSDLDLTRMIVEETDRIARLVERVSGFRDERPAPRGPVNMHAVLEHVRQVAASSFARAIRFTEDYDPSLPPVHGNRDQLVQVMLNLVKNAAEALGEAPDGEITLSSAFKPGIVMSGSGSRERVALPLEFSVRDNGPGVPEELRSHIFEPFVTGRRNGTGLGLALVAKLVGDHGGIVECLSEARRTTFRVLLPTERAAAAHRRMGVA